MSRSRAALLTAIVLVLGVPALATAAPQDCLEPSLDGAVCLLQQVGAAAQAVEGPTTPVRDAVRTTTDKALEAAGLCDPTDHAACLLPFPNDTFTVADAATKTGRRINLSPLAMPRNVVGRPIDPTEWNRNDGWSPGTPVMASVPGLSATQTHLAGITDPAASLRAAAPVLLLDAATGKRQPYWAELDANPTDGQQPLLIIRPAVNFTDGHRYVVGLRGLKDAQGHVIAPGDAFATRRTAKQTELAKQGAKGWQDPVFGPLARAGGPAQGPVSGLDVHHRQHREHHRADDPHP